MALPLKGDPRRPLHLAARSMLILAILLFAFCGVMALSVFVLITKVRTQPPMMLGIMVLMLILYGAPAAANLVFSIYMKKRQYWAIVAALVLTSIELLLMLAGAIGTSVSGDIRNGPALTVIAIEWFIVHALAQLLYHLIQSLRRFNEMNDQEERGFEVLGVQPMLPLPLPEKPATPSDFTGT